MIDLVWISSDPRRQALRDKFAHTYVIRKDAVPSGTGRAGRVIHFASLFFFNLRSTW